MATNTEKETHTIDAGGKTLGHVASEAAMVLMGKHRPDFSPHIAGNVEVTITSAKGITFTEKKLDTKQYKRYSGYPGGLKHERMRVLRDRKGVAEVIRKAVYGMLPANKLRAPRMKKLIIEE